MDNCTQFLGDHRLSCKKHGYSETNTLKFDAHKFRKYIKKEYEFAGSPFVYPNPGKKYKRLINARGSSIKSSENSNSNTQFKLKPHQKFIGKYINNHSNNNGILMYASVGSGKTLTSIVAGICQIAYYSGQPLPKITVITPANLVDNYKQELVGIGPEQILVNGKKHAYKGGNLKTAETTRFFIGNKQNNFITSKLIKKHWEIVTHQSFINGLYSSMSGLPGKNVDLLKEPGRLYIIDEVHNLVSENGEQYNKLLTAVTNYMHSTSKLILMSATPIVDSNYEIGLTLNLLRPRIPFPSTKKLFDKLTTRELKYMMYGYISYFAGGDPSLYPAKTIEMVYHRFEEGSLQYENYIKVYKKELPKKYTINKKNIGSSSSGFFVKSLIAANIFFNPVVKGEMRKYKGQQRFEFAKRNVSVKYADVCERVSKNAGTAVIFSPYIDMGVKAMAIILESIGFQRYNKDARKNDKPKYIIWSGQIKDKELFSKEILPVFNSPDNIQGKDIKVILATRAISEGITFKNVRNLHICSHFWNENIMKQIIGRCDRMNSHSALPLANRKLHVYRHIMVLPSFGKSFSFGSISSGNTEKGLNLLTDVTIEEYVSMIADNKTDKHNKMQKIIQSASVDCNMNKYGNKKRTYVFKDDSGIYIKDNVTGESTGVIVNGTVKKIDIKITEINCKVSNLTSKNKSDLGFLRLKSRNMKFGKALLTEIMHSKMTNSDVAKIEKIKFKLIKCAVKSFGPGGVPKNKQPSNIRVLRNIKEFLKTRKIKKNAQLLYKYLIKRSVPVSSEYIYLLADLRDYLDVLVV